MWNSSREQAVLGTARWEILPDISQTGSRQRRLIVVSIHRDKMFLPKSRPACRCREDFSNSIVAILFHPLDKTTPSVCRTAPFGTKNLVRAFQHDDHGRRGSNPTEFWVEKQGCPPAFQLLRFSSTNYQNVQLFTKQLLPRSSLKALMISLRNDTVANEA